MGRSIACQRRSVCIPEWSGRDADTGRLLDYVYVCKTVYII